MRSTLSLLSFLLIGMSQLRAADPIPLWPDKAPLAVGDSPVDKPSLQAFLPAKPNGVAVVICPGGGYGFLADDHEGKQVAEYFNKLGITAFVLKYRIVAKDRPAPLGKAPMLDVQRAIRYVRSKAINYHLNLELTVGVCGFSAGGHLASTAATHFDEGDKKAEDPIDRLSCRPDFAVLCYPVISMEDGVTHGGSKKNLLGDKPEAEMVTLFTNEKQVTAKTPPTFLFHTDQDTAVLPENAIRFYLALKKAKVPAELHIYEQGKHGIGLGNDPKWTGGNTYAEGWPERLAAWLKVRGFATK